MKKKEEKIQFASNNETTYTSEYSSDTKDSWSSSNYSKPPDLLNTKIVSRNDEPKLLALPLFITENHDLITFLLSLEEALNDYFASIEILKFSLLIQKQLQTIMLDIRYCFLELDQLYNTIFSILNVIDAVKHSQDAYKNKDDSWNYKLLVNAICEENNVEKYQLFINHRFPLAVKSVKASFFALYDSMKKSSYTLFSQSVFSDKTPEEFVFNGKDLIFFIFFKFWTRYNIYEIFRDFNTLDLDDFFGYDTSLLMPGVFYEYFLYCDFSNLPHNLTEGEQLYSKCYILSDYTGRNRQLKLYEKNVISNNETIVKSFVLFRDRELEVFPKFDFMMHKQMNIQFLIKLANGKIFEYHPKITGNVSKGFWVSSRHTKYFFKELYCVSDAFKIYVQKIINMYAEQNVAKNDIELALMEEQSEVSKSLSHDIYSSYISKQGIFHMNKYVELSGYFLLELFGMTPKIDAFFSKFISKPIIMVEEINKEFQLITSYNVNGDKTRYDFNIINNDRFALFLSAIPIYKLRLNQMIFLIDDFHEGNLAIKVSDLTLNQTKFIQDIQIIDIWPSKVGMTLDKFFGLNDLNGLYSGCSFDDIILSRLDFVPENDNIPLELLIQNEKGKVIEEDPQNPQHQSIKQVQIKNAQLTIEERGTIYGARIQSWNHDPMHRKAILTFYALSDLFDTTLHNNYELFSSIGSIQHNICASIAMIMLGETYQMCTNQTRTLSDLFDINKTDPPTLQQVLEFNADDLKNDWKHYLFHVANTIIGLIKHILFNYTFTDYQTYIEIPETYELTLKEDDRGRNHYIVKQIFWDKIWLAIHSYHSFGFAFSYPIVNTENALRLFNFDPDPKEQEGKFQLFEKVHGSGSRPNVFYFTRSPVVFDMINHKLSLTNKRVNEPPFNNIFIKQTPQSKNI